MIKQVLMIVVGFGVFTVFVQDRHSLTQDIINKQMVIDELTVEYSFKH